MDIPWQSILSTACDCAMTPTVRGIKLVTDFLHQLRKEGNLQNRVFVVEDNPRKTPNLKKRPFQCTSALLLNNFCPVK